MKILRTFSDNRLKLGKPVQNSQAFSLVEILIVSALLTIIVLGLLAMFQQTQKAFRVGLTQTDVLEAGRATTDLLARELEQTRPSRSTAVNFYANILYPRLQQPLVGTTRERTNFFEEVFFLTRENQTWKGIGYRIGTPDLGIGTLSRYETNCSVSIDPAWMLNDFYNTPYKNLSPVTSGVVHFKIRAYDLKGMLMTNDNNAVNSTIRMSGIKPAGDFAPGEVGYYLMTNTTVPAQIEFELGILEKRAQERVMSLSDSPTAASAYLAQQVGKVHVFRQRVSVRNVDPSVYP